MADGRQYKSVNTFVGGLITETSEVNARDNTTEDELNYDLDIKGFRSRRRGLDFEGNYALSTDTWTDTVLETRVLHAENWRGVGGDGDLHFLVVQAGNILYFYEEDNGISPSDGLKSFTIDLDTYMSPTASTTYTNKISIAYGLGNMIVVHPDCEPFYVEYSVSGDSITVTQIALKIRDFEGVDDGLDVDDATQNPMLAPHNYNLLNQGWFTTAGGYDPLGAYGTTPAPANNMIWHTIKTAGGAVDKTPLDRWPFGLTPAPKGHFIVDAFDTDRDAASGLSGITDTVIDERPTSVAFYAGRAIYGLKSTIYMSKVLRKDYLDIGTCHQVGDPTGEDSPDLVASDGVVLDIAEAGEILAMEVFGTSLIVFADNGVWGVSGVEGGGFRADDFAVSKLSNDGIVSRHGLSKGKDFIYWVGVDGIFRFQSSESTGQVGITSITDKTIATIMSAIPIDTKKDALLVYDAAKKVLTFLFKDATTADATNTAATYYNKVINFNTLTESFYPWTLQDAFLDYPYVAGVISVKAATVYGADEVVINTGGDELDVTAGDIVVVPGNSFAGSSTNLLFLTVVPDQAVSGTNNITFSQITSDSLTDWNTYATLEYTSEGLEYDSYLETAYDISGDLARQKQAPYIVTHMSQTETGYYDAGGGDYQLLKQSSCYLRAKWDWHTTGSGSKWSRQQQIYRLRPHTGDATLVYDVGESVVTSKSKLRGRGHALSLRFESEGAKEATLLGWGIKQTGNTEL